MAHKEEFNDKEAVDEFILTARRMGFHIPDEPLSDISFVMDVVKSLALEIERGKQNMNVLRLRCCGEIAKERFNQGEYAKLKIVPRRWNV